MERRDLAEGLDARWFALVATADRNVSSGLFPLVDTADRNLSSGLFPLVATADRNLSSGLFPTDCDTKGFVRCGSDTCSGGAAGTVAGIGVRFGGAGLGVRAGFCGIGGGGDFFGVGSGFVSLSKLGVGSDFDGGACFSVGA